MSIRALAPSQSESCPAKFAWGEKHDPKHPSLLYRSSMFSLDRREYRHPLQQDFI